MRIISSIKDTTFNTTCLFLLLSFKHDISHGLLIVLFEQMTVNIISKELSSFVFYKQSQI